MNGVLKTGQEKTENEEGRRKGKGIKIENFHCSLIMLCTYRP
jgi:hypothetical protein